jgi:hypothetical protein
VRVVLDCLVSHVKLKVNFRPITVNLSDEGRCARCLYDASRSYEVHRSEVFMTTCGNVSHINQGGSVRASNGFHA